MKILNDFKNKFNQIKESFSAPPRYRIDPALKSNLMSSGYTPEQIDQEFTPENVAKPFNFAQKEQTGGNSVFNQAPVPFQESNPTEGLQAPSANNIENTAQSTPEMINSGGFLEKMSKPIPNVAFEDLPEDVQKKENQRRLIMPVGEGMDKEQTQKAMDVIGTPAVEKEYDAYDKLKKSIGYLVSPREEDLVKDSEGNPTNLTKYGELVTGVDDFGNYKMIDLFGGVGAMEDVSRNLLRAGKNAFKKIVKEGTPEVVEKADGILQKIISKEVTQEEAEKGLKEIESMAENIDGNYVMWRTESRAGDEGAKDYWFDSEEGGFGEQIAGAEGKEYSKFNVKIKNPLKVNDTQEAIQKLWNENEIPSSVKSDLELIKSGGLDALGDQGTTNLDNKITNRAKELKYDGIIFKERGATGEAVLFDKNNFKKYEPKLNVEDAKKYAKEYEGKIIDFEGNKYEVIGKNRGSEIILNDIETGDTKFFDIDNLNKIKPEKNLKIIDGKVVDTSLTKVPEENQRLTTPVLDELDGKGNVSVQYINDLLKKPTTKKIERELIEQAIEDTEKVGGKINAEEVANKVRSELLPLKIAKDRPDRYAGNQRYENISLPDELKGDVADYTEHIYESPIETSAGSTHFSGATDNYFGHTRVEDMADPKKIKAYHEGKIKDMPAGDIRRVIEVQSDLYQKGNLEREIENTDFDKLYNGRYLPTQEKIDKIVSKREKEIEKLKQYSDPTAHYRMIREELALAEKDGKTKLQFPTGETAMKIEGLYQNPRDFPTWSVMTEDGLDKLEPDMLKSGKTILDRNDTEWIVVDYIGDGQFRAIPKDKMESAGLFKDNKFNVPKSEIGEMKIGDKTYYYNEKTLDESFIEEFELSEELNKDNPIYKFYDKDVRKFLKKFDGKEITDEQGVNWIEVDLTKQKNLDKINAFGFTNIGAMTGATAVGAAGLAGAASMQDKDKEEPETAVNTATEKTPEVKGVKNEVPEITKEENKDQTLKWNGERKNLKDIDTSVIPNKSNKKSGIIRDAYSDTDVKLNDKQVKVANRIADIAEHFGHPEWIPYLQSLSYHESKLGEEMINKKNKNGSVDNGYFMINDKAFPKVGTDITNDLDKATIWAIGLINSGEQYKWVANKHALKNKIRWD